MRPGEDYVARISFTETRTALFNDLVGNVTDAAGDVRVANIGKLDASLLVYFAASVVWRASVASVLPSCLLGAYEEPFRKFLMDEAGYPADSACLLTFHDLPTLAGVYLGSMCFQPSSTTHTTHTDHMFLVHGLLFYLACGRQSLPCWRDLCLTGGPPTVLLASHEQLLDLVAQDVARAKRVGQLAR